MTAVSFLLYTRMNDQKRERITVVDFYQFTGFFRIGHAEAGFNRQAYCIRRILLLIQLFQSVRNFFEEPVQLVCIFQESGAAMT